MTFITLLSRGPISLEPSKPFESDTQLLAGKVVKVNAWCGKRSFLSTGNVKDSEYFAGPEFRRELDLRKCEVVRIPPGHLTTADAVYQ